MPSIDRLSAGSANQVLSSDWTGLSRYLIASFFPVRRVVDGTNIRWERVADSAEVQAPLTDGTAEQVQNWHSPFESQSADAKLSSLSSLFQIGGFEAILNAVQRVIPRAEALDGTLSAAQHQLQTLEGRTAVTKLNSTQVYSGSPPLKITITAHFRALTDPLAEVVRPMDQLMAWSLPKKLATQGLVGNLLDEAGEAGVRTVWPSETPQIIGMAYGGMLFKPLVIELMPYQLTTPRDIKGRPISGQLTMTLATLTAIDKDDWADFRRI